MRLVDRAHFVPKHSLEAAHSDQPLKVGNVHISAPHMYGSILESLDLEEDSKEGLSFLNIGCGTGYLSCIVACVLGSKSKNLNFGVEIYEDVIQHCHESVQKWKNTHAFNKVVQDVHLEVVHGNGLCISLDDGEARVGFDRIYIGATLSLHHLKRVLALLAPGGILVCPCEDNLIKVTRRRFVQDNLLEYEQDYISCVRFAFMVEEPQITTKIPAFVWSPSQHNQYPSNFMKGVQITLLCAKSRPKITTGSTASSPNAINLLPAEVLKEVFSFMDRRWFDHKDERSAAEKSGSLLLSLRYLTVNWRRRLEDITEATIAEYVDGNNRIAIRQHPEHGFYMLFNAVDEDHDMIEEASEEGYHNESENDNESYVEDNMDGVVENLIAHDMMQEAILDELFQDLSAHREERSNPRTVSIGEDDLQL